MNKDNLKLKDGSKIAVIGAGPAGTFFANFAADIAKQKGINVTISIFDAKKFIAQGPSGCNMCAGIISEALVKRMEKIGIVIPEQKIQQRIDGYYLHTKTDKYLLAIPSKKGKIIAVFRGNGPRFYYPEGNESFDDFLLDHVKKKGIIIIPEMITDIRLPKDGNSPVTLIYGENKQKFDADLVVGAFGLNTRMIEKIKNLNIGYEPPKTITTCQAEIMLGKEYIKEHFGNNVFIFTLGEKMLRYVAVIPKNEFITVSVVGSRDTNKAALINFLDSPLMRQYLPKDWQMPEKHCLCYPKIATTPAKNPFTDRLVLIGDTSFSRYYKNGIESAFITAKFAAETSMNSGVSIKSFKKGYLKKANNIIIKDNLYGRILFRINDIISKFPIIAESHIRILDSTSLLREIIWNMFTGDIPYRKILIKSLNPILQFKLVLSLAFLTVKNILIPKKYSRILFKENLGPLKNGQTVVILGGGPAGVGCAIALKNLSKEKNLSLKVVLYEGKEFEKELEHNQCMGVLSPPIRKIFEEKLKIDFPERLVQREITGYVLHSEHNQVLLEGFGEMSSAVRRITFDKYMLESAKKLGVEIIHSRITDIEYGVDGLMVYSESNNLKTDVIVGAFGLDYGSIKIFEKNMPYKAPRHLSSIVTKLHPGEEIISAYENYIHAFLPADCGIEFGAVTPKKNHLTINIAGYHITSEIMDKFLEFPQVRSILPLNFALFKDNLEYYKGNFPISTAKGFYGDRYVLIGDAAGMVRPFKGKGINSALTTGILAAETMINCGISKRALKNYYRGCSEITKDIPYARLIRFFATTLGKTRIFDFIIEKAKKDSNLNRFLYNCVSASKSYKASIFEYLFH